MQVVSDFLVSVDLHPDGKSLLTVSRGQSLNFCTLFIPRIYYTTRTASQVRRGDPVARSPGCEHSPASIEAGFSNNGGPLDHGVDRVPKDSNAWLSGEARDYFTHAHVIGNSPARSRSALLCYPERINLQPRLVSGCWSRGARLRFSLHTPEIPIP